MADEKQKIQLLVRVANTDLDGNKQLRTALTKIKGVNYSLASAICSVTGLAQDSKTGLLAKADVEKLDKAVRDPIAFGIPSWMVNRQKDYETGKDKHLITADLDFTKQNDIKRLSKIKSYRGLRHQWGLPVRGQRTSSNFRKSKTKSAAAAKKGRRKAGAQ